MEVFLVSFCNLVFLDLLFSLSRIMKIFFKGTVSKNAIDLKELWEKIMIIYCQLHSLIVLKESQISRTKLFLVKSVLISFLSSYT